jgi:nickel and cobalt resistance protein CnrR
LSAFQRHLLIAVVLAGAAGFLGVWLGARRLDPPDTPPAPLRMAIDELTRRGLVGLTDAQKSQIVQIKARYDARRTALRGQIAGANTELANALAQEMSLGPLAEGSIKDLGAAVGQLQRETVVYILDLRAVLTPQQQVVFDQKVVAALSTVPR